MVVHGTSDALQNWAQAASPVQQSQSTDSTVSDSWPSTPGVSFPPGLMATGYRWGHFCHFCSFRHIWHLFVSLPIRKPWVFFFSWEWFSGRKTWVCEANEGFPLQKTPNNKRKTTTWKKRGEIWMENSWVVFFFFFHFFSCFPLISLSCSFLALVSYFCSFQKLVLFCFFCFFFFHFSVTFLSSPYPVHGSGEKSDWKAGSCATSTTLRNPSLLLQGGRRKKKKEKRTKKNGGGWKTNKSPLYRMYSPRVDFS